MWRVFVRKRIISRENIKFKITNFDISQVVKFPNFSKRYFYNTDVDRFSSRSSITKYYAIGFGFTSSRNSFLFSHHIRLWNPHIVVFHLLNGQIIRVMSYTHTYIHCVRCLVLLYCNECEYCSRTERAEKSLPGIYFLALTTQRTRSHSIFKCLRARSSKCHASKLLVVCLYERAGFFIPIASLAGRR